jgi:hypothetical protein
MGLIFDSSLNDPLSQWILVVHYTDFERLQIFNLPFGGCKK